MAKRVIKAVYILIQTLQTLALEKSEKELGRFFKELIVAIGKGASGKEEPKGDTEASAMAKELLENARKAQQKTSENGKKGAQARWGKTQDENIGEYKTEQDENENPF